MEVQIILTLQYLVVNTMPVILYLQGKGPFVFRKNGAKRVLMVSVSAFNHLIDGASEKKITINI